MLQKLFKRMKYGFVTRNVGSTIIELLIAVMVVGLIITAVANAVTTSIKNTGESRFRENATVLGQQVIEYMHGRKNELGMVNFKNTYTAGNYCFITVESPISSACGTNDLITMAGTSFKRNAVITSGGNGTRANPYYLNIRVTVSWQDGASTRDIELIQEFQQDAGFTN